ncbi:MAG: GNAT family N-acetyltransferase [Lachnospiraceae bacterium]|nr:GNAT family N-acetyltransferase [Lachnospiraceae bacterium]
MIRLRPYKESDAPIILSWCETEIDFYKWTAGVLGNYPLTENDFNEVKALMPFTAFDDTGIIGFFTLRNPKDSLDKLRFGFVIVDPKVRNKGYGKAMLQKGLRFVFDIYGAKKASLGVFENNQSAYYCYKATGFKDVQYKDEEIYHVLNEDWKCKELELIKQ